MSTAEELNRFNANRIAENYNHGGSKALEDAIFSELQVADKRAELLSELKVEELQARIAEFEELIEIGNQMAYELEDDLLHAAWQTSQAWMQRVKALQKQETE